MVFKAFFIVFFMDLGSYDSIPIPGEVVSFEIKISNSKILCIGYKFLGGDKCNPRNYVYNHTNGWNEWECEGRISKSKAIAILAKANETLDSTLLKYIQAISDYS
jgi:hypothetical protein